MLYAKHIHKPKIGLPHLLSLHFNCAMLGKFIVVGIFTGPILIPIFWLTNIPYFQSIANFGWEFGKSFCTYTTQSFSIGGVPMMVCARCFGAACGILAAGLTYFYAPTLRKFLPTRRLYLAAALAALFVPWLVDSGLERLQLWVTNFWFMVPTGFLGGVAVTLAPLLFWPRDEADDFPLDLDATLEQKTQPEASKCYAQS